MTSGNPAHSPSPPPGFSPESARESLNALKRITAATKTSPDYVFCRNSDEQLLAEQRIVAGLDRQRPVCGLLDRLIATGIQIKHDATSTVVRSRIGDTDVILKRYNKRGFSQWLKMLVAKTRAEKAFFRALTLREFGIPTPQPLLYAFRRRYGVAGTSYIVMARSRGETICDLYDSGRLAAHSWPEVISEFRNILDRLHGNAITHGDVKTPNLLFDGTKPEIIDLDPLRIHRCRWLFERFRDKDIDAFNRRVRDYPKRNGVK